MQLATVTVVTERLEEAKKALEKLAKKAHRYGCPDISWEIGKEVVKTHVVRDWDGEERHIKVSHTELIITGEALRYGNHEFLAHIELHEGGNLVDKAPGVEDLDHKFRDSTGFCEHCKTARRRNDVYAVRNLDNGEQLQVGRTCLRDYLGVDPAAIIHRFALFRGAMELEDEYSFGSSKAKWHQSIEGALALAAVCIRLYGWCSKSAAAYKDVNPTVYYVGLVLGLISRPSEQQKEQIREILAARTEADYELAKKTLHWVREEWKDNSDYAHNLRVIFSADVLHDERRLGLAVSAVGTYQRLHEGKAKRHDEIAAKFRSQHVGKVGERLRDLKLILRSQRVINGNDWGDVVLVKFEDESGNMFSWFTGRGTKLDDGSQVLVTGTVKRHGEYNGVLETQLSRCTVEKVN
jgi:hypothetical protein